MIIWYEAYIHSPQASLLHSVSMAPEPADVITAAADDDAGGGCGDPQPSLLLALPHLPLPELLSAHRVCRQLSDAVAGDVLLWRRLAVAPPLSGRLTDDALVRAAARAAGTLESLALLNCRNVTDSGLLRVAGQNPGISKLSVPGCSNLTADGLVRVVKLLSQQKGNLKLLRIRGLSNITREHFDILSSFLYRSDTLQLSRPSFYIYQRTLPLDDEHPIDVDVCPKCANVRMVFDCTRESCRLRKSRWTECRGCFFCIARCEECGGCMDLEELEEAACSDLLCLECWLRLPKCNMCNQPYCKRHASIHVQSSGSDGFVCERCMSNETSPSYCYD